MSAIAVGEITIIDLHDEDVHIGTTAPVDLKDGRLWLDTSTVPNVMKRWDAATQKWIKASPTSAGDIGAETPSGAQDKADGAEDAAKTYAGDILKDLADGDYVGGTFIDGKSVISPTVVGLQGTFAELMAGDPFGARLEMGESAGEPFLEAYDSNNKLRVKLLQDRLAFSIGGVDGGNILAEEFAGASGGYLKIHSNHSVAIGALNRVSMQSSGATIECFGDTVAMWADLGIHLLGNVELNGKDLGGAVIVESGSNANGEYVRWGNGTQVCWHLHELKDYVTNRLRTNWVYPKGFINNPAVISSLTDIDYNSVTPLEPSLLRIQSIGTSFCIPHLWNTGIVSGDSVKIYVLAIGWWK